MHRDIKPDNILVNKSGEVKITDFGISKSLEETEEMCKTFVGTMNYMSPERMAGEKYSYASDIWSLGIILIELASGKYPFKLCDNYIEIMEIIKMTPTEHLCKNKSFSP